MRRARVAILCVGLLIFLSIIVPTAAVAIASGAGLRPPPYELLLVLQRLPILFPLHMVASGLSLILIPIAAGLRRRRGPHRIFGRAAAVAVGLGALSALPVALASEAPLIARAGFFVQGVVWLNILVAGVVAIRRGDRIVHRRRMIAMAAVASGAVWLRLVISVAVATELPFETVYCLAAWACWALPLGVAVLATRNRRDFGDNACLGSPLLRPLLSKSVVASARSVPNCNRPWSASRRTLDDEVPGDPTEM